MDFTETQRRAIEHRGGHLQMVACAGSGKTEVVARRIARLLDPTVAGHVEPANVVAFTFTDKAAAELRQRVTDRSRGTDGEPRRGMADLFVGTIHAFCLELLKTEVPRYLGYEVLDEVQQKLLVDRYSQRAGLTTSTDLAGEPLRRYRDSGRYVQALALLREAELEPGKLGDVSVCRGLASYRALLDEKRYLDYTAIMSEAVELLRTDAGLRRRVRARIKHVIVDEYQDVNPIQEALIAAMAGLGATLCVVGDDDQTIYQWRGGDVGNILTFAQRYPGATQVRLEENFRSTEGVIATAREFIAQNPARLEKAMRAGTARASEAGDLVALSFDSAQDEARWVAGAIRDLRGVAFQDHDGRERGLAWSDVAILLRSVRANAKPLMEALDAAEIPYVVGGMNNLFETPEAGAARTLFLFLGGAEGVDEARVRQAWLEARLGIDEGALDHAVEAAVEVRAGLEAGAHAQRWSYYNLQRVFQGFLEDLGLQEGRVPGAGRGEVVFSNLGKFSEVISDFESIWFHAEPTAKYDEFARFLTFDAGDAYPEGWQEGQCAAPDAVKIMTVHQAKGLQWPAVFLPALLRNRFPAAAVGGRNVWHLLPRQAVRGQERFEGSVADERRLFYVAMTRSQKFLYLTWAPIPGKGNRYLRASEFFEDVLASPAVKRRAPDLAARRRLPVEPRAGEGHVTLSFSELKYFFECPYQFKLRILYGFNPPLHEALGFGRSLHDALAEAHAQALQGKAPDPAEQLVERHLHLPYAYPELRETLHAKACDLVRKYLRKNASGLREVQLAEQTVDIPMGEGVTVTGRIDLVRSNGSGQTTIVDFKSCHRAQAEELTERQLHLYALGYRYLTGRNADLVETYLLDEGSRVRRAVDDEFMAEVTAAVQGAARALRANTLPPKPAPGACESCDYDYLCGRAKRAA